jgi:hypothetical protein
VDTTAVVTTILSKQGTAIHAGTFPTKSWTHSVCTQLRLSPTAGTTKWTEPVCTQELQWWRRNLTNEFYTFVHAFTFSSPMVVQKRSDGVAKPYWKHSGVECVLERLLLQVLWTASTSNQVSKWWLPQSYDNRHPVRPLHTRSTSRHVLEECINLVYRILPQRQRSTYLLSRDKTVEDEADTIFRNVGNVLPKIRHTRTLVTIFTPDSSF